MQLSKYFTLEELVLSQAAARLNINNTPNSAVLSNLIITCKELDKVRELLGCPILVSSGYRSPEVNKAVGGAAKSMHVEGRAVDFTAPTFGNPRQIVQKILDASIPFDQVIYEFESWVHISFSPTNRNQALVIDKHGTRIFK